MRTVSAELSRNHPRRAVTHEDKIGCAVSFLRCAERCDVVGQIRNANRYGHLNALADAKDPFLRESGAAQLVRDHVMELAGADISERIQALKSQLF